MCFVWLLIYSSCALLILSNNKKLCYLLILNFFSSNSFFVNTFMLFSRHSSQKHKNIGFIARLLCCSPITAIHTYREHRLRAPVEKINLWICHLFHVFIYRYLFGSLSSKRENNSLFNNKIVSVFPILLLVYYFCCKVN